MKLHEVAKDRYLRGAIAGVTAGLLMNIISLIIVEGFNFGEDLATDYMTEMLLGRQSLILFEKIISIFAHLLFTGLLGVLFSYLLLLIGSKFIIFKGISYSWTAWFMLYSVGILFEVPLLKINTAETVTIHAITALVYGLVLSISISYLEKIEQKYI